MNWNQQIKEQVQYASACFMLLSGVSMGFAALAMNAWHLIPDSVLWFVAQCFVYAGSIFGVAMVISYKFGQMTGGLHALPHPSPAPVHGSSWSSGASSATPTAPSGSSSLTASPSSGPSSPSTADSAPTPPPAK